MTARCCHIGSLEATPDSVASFKARAVRLFSMLHAAALAELEVPPDAEAWKMWPWGLTLQRKQGAVQK